MGRGVPGTPHRPTMGRRPCVCSKDDSSVLVLVAYWPEKKLVYPVARSELASIKVIIATTLYI